MTLDQLLTRAGVLSTWDRVFWFGGCTLRGAVLLVPEADVAATLTRCYLPQLRTVLSDCEIRVGPAPVPSGKPTVYRGESRELKAGDLWAKDTRPPR